MIMSVRRDFSPLDSSCLISAERIRGLSSRLDSGKRDLPERVPPLVWWDKGASPQRRYVRQTRLILVECPTEMDLMGLLVLAEAS